MAKLVDRLAMLEARRRSHAHTDHDQAVANGLFALTDEELDFLHDAMEKLVLAGHATGCDGETLIAVLGLEQTARVAEISHKARTAGEAASSQRSGSSR